MIDWTAFAVSLKLAAGTAVILLPLGIASSRVLAFRVRRGKALLEALIALPLVLPPTVLGFYLLVSFGDASPLGRAWSALFGHPLAFSFGGLLVASLIVNLPFAVQPMQRAFEALPPDLREAAWVSGLTPWQTFVRIELPLAWPGVLSAFALTFAHTMGEFGVVLMVGGNIPGVTRTVSIGIYDQVQASNYASANAMALLLLVFCFAVLTLVYGLNRTTLPQATANRKV